MEDKRSKSSEPDWLDLRNDRTTPYSDAELDRLTDDQIAMLADTPAWLNLVADVGMQRAGEVVKERLAGRDTNTLINWHPSGPVVRIRPRPPCAKSLLQFDVTWFGQSWR